ncbi:MAG: hypothetical protein Q8938_20200 [Bacteroidota bacterium]|nr:hypothetical protein [Bacteroidota bacterium]
MQVSDEVLKELRAFNRNCDWLKKQSLKDKPEAWVSYEEASKILPRSKEWYKGKRLITQQLVRGRDWRTIGNRVEYRLEAIIELKQKLSS